MSDLAVLPEPGLVTTLAGRALIALVPAHDEEDRVGAAVSGLQAQTTPPSRVLVVADRCTDATELVARRAGAEVFTTRDNRDKKAGALNQALADLLPKLDDDDLVLVQDADSQLAPDWVTTALAVVDRHRCVGGVFAGESGGGLVGQLQRSEFVRYAWDVRRRGDRAMVLTGTASVFRVDLLREIAGARGSSLPGRHGQVYDTLALTEDNEITLAARTLGADPVSPAGCAVITEVMTTPAALWRQRVRWQRGAIENLRAYGLTRTTAPYVGQQAMLALGTAMMAAYLVLTACAAVTGGFGVKPLWLLVGLVFVVERLVSAWRGGRTARALSLLMIPEIAYAVFLQLVLLTAYAQILTRRTAVWGQAPARRHH